MNRNKIKFVYFSWLFIARFECKHIKMCELHWNERKFSAIGENLFENRFIIIFIWNRSHVPGDSFIENSIYISCTLLTARALNRISAAPIQNERKKKKKKVELYRFAFNDRSPYNENANFCSWTIHKIIRLLSELRKAQINKMRIVCVRMFG